MYLTWQLKEILRRRKFVSRCHAR